MAYNWIVYAICPTNNKFLWLWCYSKVILLENGSFVVEGHPAPDGASPTQPYKCGQNVKSKVKNTAVGAENFQPLPFKTALTLTLTLTF